MTAPARLLRVVGVGVVIVLALVAILTALRTELPRGPGVQSDALGPDAGERVEDYLARAAASLADVGGAGAAARGGVGGDDDEVTATGDDAPRWALVSAGEAWTATGAARVVEGLPRVSALYVQVPVDGVAMPVADATLAEPAAGESGRAAVVGRALDEVAAQLDGAPGGDVGTGGDLGTGGWSGTGGDRASAAAALTATRIRAGAPAIIGLVVRGSTDSLRAVATRPGVRAVEALPPDAVWGRFAVRPLQPQQVEAATPLADTAAVPAA